MRNRLRRLSLLLAVLLLCVACRETADSLGNDRTQPIDRIIEAIQTQNAASYEAAFLPDFCASYHAFHPALTETVSRLLATAKQVNEDAYGKDCAIRYELVGQTALSLDSLDESIRYTGLDEFPYTLPTADISELWQLRLRLICSGSYASETRELTVLVLRVGERYYLHPQHFGSVLRTA